MEENKKYFVIEIVTADGATAKQITEKATETEAWMLYHQIMASAYANPNVTYALCQIIDERGFALINDKLPHTYED